MIKKFFCIVMLTLITACTSLPQLYQTAEDIANNDCITIKVDKDAFQKDTNVDVMVQVKNSKT
jgi:starvation-inducible outer membrane lipoprotein